MSINQRETARHGAQFSNPILDVIFNIIRFSPRPILDPMGGVGKLARNWPEGHVITGELEYAWVVQAPGMSVQQDVHALPYRVGSIGTVVTSPDYGNRFADHHNAKDASKRNAYAFWLREVGVEPHPNNGGLLHFGPRYKAHKIMAYREIRRVLQPGGRFILNVSDFIKNFEVVRAVDWHERICTQLGFTLERKILVATPRLKYGENHEARVEHEVILVWRGP